MRLTASALLCLGCALPTMAADGVAVVELFTSEGCSSCPPAEAVFATLRNDALVHHQQVYALLFPVDYWDRLGWKDPHARPEFTARQRDYARALGLEQVFTPQAIVNGTVSLVGSDQRALRHAIAEACARPARVAVAQDVRWAHDGVHVTVRLTDAPTDAQVTVALSESGLTSVIRAGENAGRTDRVHA